MIADGLTKTLTARKHVRFTKQIGLVDIKGEIDRRRKLEKLSKDFFEDLEDSFEGGEAEVAALWFNIFSENRNTDLSYDVDN